jgi:hypothetical protein
VPAWSDGTVKRYGSGLLAAAADVHHRPHGVAERELERRWTR